MKTIISIKVRPIDLRRRNLLHIPATYKTMFPQRNPTCSINMNMDGILEKVTYCSTPHRGTGIRNFGLTKWFKNHPELTVESQLRIIVADSTPQYSLEIVKN